SDHYLSGWPCPSARRAAPATRDTTARPTPTHTTGHTGKANPMAATSADTVRPTLVTHAAVVIPLLALAGSGRSSGAISILDIHSPCRWCGHSNRVVTNATATRAR